MLVLPPTANLPSVSEFGHAKLPMTQVLKREGTSPKVSSPGGKGEQSMQVTASVQLVEFTVDSSFTAIKLTVSSSVSPQADTKKDIEYEVSSV